MKKENYTAAIEVAQPPDHVFNCIKEVPKWWTRDFHGSNDELNDEFIIEHPGEHYSKQKLVETIPGKKIVWLVIESTLPWLQNDKHEWTNTKMIFEISPEGKGDKTLLHFTHEGLTPEKECYPRVSHGWDTVINWWLLDYITTGKTI